MKIEKLSVQNFRNISHIEIAPTPGVNIIWGENGQGKTNLLEAIWLCTGAKTFRTGTESDFIPLEDPINSHPKVHTVFKAMGREQSIDLVFGEPKETYLNGISKGLRSRLAGEFLATVFSPDDLSLIKSAPALRRRFMDTAICQMYPAYLSLLRRYQKAMSQRNALLKNMAYSPKLAENAEPWDVILSDAGEKIEEYRTRFVKELLLQAVPVYEGISDGREVLSIAYTKGREDTLSYRDALRSSMEKDRMTKTTNVGIHRDDLTIALNGRSARIFGSQGQQRSCVLAMKLAEAAMVKRLTDSTPVILLDDVMSELDDSRRTYILEKTKGFQVFITCCEPSVLGTYAGDGQKIWIEKGRIRE